MPLILTLHGRVLAEVAAPYAAMWLKCAVTAAYEWHARPGSRFEGTEVVDVDLIDYH